MSSQPTETELAGFRQRLGEMGEEAIRDHLRRETWGDGPRSWKWIQATEYLDASQADRDDLHRQDAFRLAREADARSQDAYRLAEEALKAVEDARVTSRRAVGGSRAAQAWAVLAFILAALAVVRSFGWI